MRDNKTNVKGANQGDCKIILANLRNFPRVRGFLQDKSSLGEASFSRKSPCHPPHIWSEELFERCLGMISTNYIRQQQYGIVDAHQKYQSDTTASSVDISVVDKNHSKIFRIMCTIGGLGRYIERYIGRQ